MSNRIKKGKKAYFSPKMYGMLQDRKHHHKLTDLLGKIRRLFSNKSLQRHSRSPV
jgi:hypothetical protein